MHRPKVDDVIEVRWLDSGISGYGKPGQDKVHLKYNVTYGKVSHIGSSDELCDKVLCAAHHRCAILELAMCSAGYDDSRSELAVIWWPSVVEWRKLA